LIALPIVQPALLIQWMRLLPAEQLQVALEQLNQHPEDGTAHQFRPFLIRPSVWNWGSENGATGLAPGQPGFFNNPSRPDGNNEGARPTQGRALSPGEAQSASPGVTR
jgi:hypothetical protein